MAGFAYKTASNQKRKKSPRYIERAKLKRALEERDVMFDLLWRVYSLTYNTPGQALIQWRRDMGVGVSNLLDPQPGKPSIFKES